MGDPDPLPTGPALDAERAGRPAPATPEQIREAAHTLRVVYLPVMGRARTRIGGGPYFADEEDWRAAPDLSEALADVLDRQADLLADLLDRGTLQQLALLPQLPEWAALFHLIRQILEAHP